MRVTSVEPGATTSARGVFISGTGHSGSTLLMLLLGGHSSVVGLGDVTSSINQNGEDPDVFRATMCSCGELVANCVFWGPTADALTRHAGGSLVDGYRVVTERFREQFGTERLFVDSSRNLRGLVSLRDADTEVVAIHLLRDVRSWTISMVDRYKRPGRREIRGLVRRDDSRGLSGFRVRLPSQYFRLWHRTNRDIRSGIDSTAVPLIRIGYEELATAPVQMLRMMCSALQIPFEETMLRPARSHSHAASGNNMRLKAAKLEAVAYDTRWLTRSEWMRPARLHRRIMRYNAAEVYSNSGALPWGW